MKEITREVYDQDYSILAPADPPASPKGHPPSGDWPSLLRKTVVKAATQEHDELATFWGTPIEHHTCDPIQYWQGALVARPDSRLAKMALDYLSAPASSVDVERAFSRGALTVTHRRHCLSDTSTRNSIVLGGWLKDTDLVPRQKLIEFFRKKSSRLEPTPSDSEEMDDVDDSISDMS